MDISSFLPISSFFFNQILDNIRVTGLVLSQKIMENYNQKQIHKILGDIDINRINYEKYENISIFVVAKFDNDQIWLVRFCSRTIIMFASEY